VSTPLAWRCPNASAADPFHVLHIVPGEVREDPIDDDNPFVRYGPALAWWAFARANGMPAEVCESLTRDVAQGFVTTPFTRSEELSRGLGVDLWVKDETGNVAGSHKARHLISILLHLRAAEELGMLGERPRLAIASCGNAALAAATLAARVHWPIDVYVPTWMDDAVGAMLDGLGADVHRCARRDDDPPGDPAIVVQVGGGAFAACVGAGLGPSVRLDTIQAEGCAPLSMTWGSIVEVNHPERYWGQVMRPWPDPHSLADGILDDETYDWIAVVAAMVASGGEPIVAPESEIVAAHQLATAAGFDVSATGSAGLAGVLAARDRLRNGERIVVVMSGVARS